jgi:DNA-directed RNA polymerase subunit RPC12/RpoP
MTLTTHGHHIPGTHTQNEHGNHRFLNCGGAEYCERCRTEVLIFEVESAACTNCSSTTPPGLICLECGRDFHRIRGR